MSKFIIAYNLFYSLFVGFGGFGSGIDVHISYYDKNLVFDSETIDSLGVTDLIGWYLSTLNLGSIYLGPFVASLVYNFGLSLLLSRLNNRLGVCSVAFLPAFVLVLSFSWPALMSCTNVLRQGIMSGFFYAAMALDAPFTIGGLVLLAISSLSHKSGVILISFLLITMAIRLSSPFVSRALAFQAQSFSSIIILFMFALVWSAALLFPFSRPAGDAIAGDYSNVLCALFLPVSFFYSMRFFGLMMWTDTIFLSALLSAPILFAGYNWEYERICMILLPPYIFAVTAIFQPRHRFYVALCLSVGLFFMTMRSGVIAELTPLP